MTAPRRLDLVVVGGGPSGLAAADAAASQGRRVLLLDQGIRTGGQIWRHREGDHLPRVARELISAAAVPRIAVANRATVIDAASPNELIVSFRGRVAVVETDAVVLALGATELLLPFPGWTLPGVVGVGGLQALCKAGLTLAGARVALLGSGPLLLPVAATVRRAGAELVALGEQAAAERVRRFALTALRDPRRALQAAALRTATLGVRYRTDSWPVRAHGSRKLERITWVSGGAVHEAACDWLATSGGLVPRTDLAALLGCAIADGAIAVDERQRTTRVAVWAAGECCGIKGDAAARVEGAIAGLAAAGVATIPERLMRQREAGRRFGRAMRDAFVPRPELRQRLDDDTIICRCEDVRWGDLLPEWGQREAKLQSRIGMGSCQGAVCGAACTALLDWPANTVRPPLDAPALGPWASAIARLTPAGDEAPVPPRPPVA